MENIPAPEITHTTETLFETESIVIPSNMVPPAISTEHETAETITESTVQIPASPSIDSNIGHESMTRIAWGGFSTNRPQGLTPRGGSSTLVASMAYGGGLTLGGVFSRQNTDGKSQDHEEDVSVMAVNDPGAFERFYITNVMALITSFTVVLLVMTGLPCDGRVRVCLLMCMSMVACISVVLSQTFAIDAFTPRNYQRSNQVLSSLRYSSFGWCIFIVAYIALVVVNRIKMNSYRN